MNAVLYPVARNAEGALNAPLGRAARAREAKARAKAEVAFVTEETGPGFSNRDAALDAWKGRLDDDRPGARTLLDPEDRFCALREVLATEGRKRSAPAPVRPSMTEGRRWPQPPPRPATVWRLSVSYWKLVEGEDDHPPVQARAARRDPEAGEKLDARALRRVAEAPLQPVRPQQPLDIGLFEFRPPEAPDRVMPDE